MALIGEMLVQRGLVAEKDLSRALDLQGKIGGRLGSLLMRLGAVSEESLLQVLSEQLALPVVSAEELPSEAGHLARWAERTGVEKDWWLDQEVIAWESENGAVRIATRDPLDPSLNEALEKILDGSTLEYCLVRSHDFEQGLDQWASGSRERAAGGGDELQLRELAEEAPVIEFVNNLLAQAFDQRASDVHIEPEQHRFHVRMRVDGVLYNRFTLPIQRYRAIASRIKLISGMDIAERRLPQDGRLETRVSGEEVDIRVSAVPGVYGESIVMRLLPKEQKGLRIETLGLASDYLASLRRWAHEPHGIILVTGPTGSGKSTTLYSVLADINDGEKKIVTVEDPVEFRLPGITQVQTQEEIGYTFARALRAFLRQDPDVIMVGEIRDLETAEIAVQASLTGHLVLSTLHTNDAASAITRLVDMGIEPFLVATPVRGIMAQRLVRTLCNDCAEPHEPVDEIKVQVEKLLPGGTHQPSKWRQPVGCHACHGTGFRGRTGIHEMISITPEIQQLIVRGAASGQIEEAARNGGFRSLREDGFIKAYEGITSVEEVLRVTSG